MSWVSIKYKLPEVGQAVLVAQTYPPETIFNAACYPLHSCFIDVAEFSFGGIFRRREGEVRNVSHWMPLPTKPTNADE